MQIIPNRPQYIDQLVNIVDEYRMFCGFPSAPEETKCFFENLMDKGESVTFLAIDELTDTVMGFVNLYPSYSTLALKPLWILNDLGVSKAFRGQGVAKALIDEVLSFAIKTNAIRVELKTEKSNHNAQRLYKSIGFEVDGGNIYYRVPI